VENREGREGFDPIAETRKSENTEKIPTPSAFPPFRAFAIPMHGFFATLRVLRGSIAWFRMSVAQDSP